VELLIGVILLVVAGVFLVRAMQQGKERQQRQQLVAALEEWQLTSIEEEREKIAPRILALLKANPKLHDAKSSYGFTPLHLATRYGNRDIAQRLLDHGADVNVKDNYGSTPLHGAAYKGYKEVAELLLVKDADINAKNNADRTPLDYAKARADQPLIELLRKHGAKE
jgi:ankyrin repeat protein